MGSQSGSALSSAGFASASDTGFCTGDSLVLVTAVDEGKSLVVSTAVDEGHSLVVATAVDERHSLTVATAVDDSCLVVSAAVGYGQSRMTDEDFSVSSVTVTAGVSGVSHIVSTSTDGDWSAALVCDIVPSAAFVDDAVDVFDITSSVAFADDVVDLFDTVSSAAFTNDVVDDFGVISEALIDSLVDVFHSRSSALLADGAVDVFHAISSALLVDGAVDVFLARSSADQSWRMSFPGVVSPVPDPLSRDVVTSSEVAAVFK